MNIAKEDMKILLPEIKNIVNDLKKQQILFGLTLLEPIGAQCSFPSNKEIEMQ